MFCMFGSSAEVHTCSMEAMGLSLEVRGFRLDSGIVDFSLQGGRQRAEIGRSSEGCGFSAHMNV